MQKLTKPAGSAAICPVGIKCARAGEESSVGILAWIPAVDTHPPRGTNNGRARQAYRVRSGVWRTLRPELSGGSPYEAG